jgi:hypothetical protein
MSYRLGTVWFGLVLVLAEKEHFYMLGKVGLTLRQELPKSSNFRLKTVAKAIVQGKIFSTANP